MGLHRVYRLVCDGCGLLHERGSFYDKPRRARAAARRDGWQRRNMGGMLTFSDGSGQYQAWGPWRDYCPACLDSMDDLAVERA